MERDELWAEIDAQRVRTADLLAELPAAEWDQPSLCEGWTVRDVAAHLTLQQAGVRDVLRTIGRHPGAVLRGDMNTMIRQEARRQATLPQDSIIAAIRGMVGSRRHNFGVTPQETLVDICVHSQDIAIPLGRDLPLTFAAAVTAADRVWQLGWPWHAAKRFHGIRFVADDGAWAVGDGVEVRGPAESVLLVLTGRDAGAQRLSGPGFDRLTRIQSSPS